MQNLRDEQKEQNITIILEKFDRLPTDLKEMALAYMQEILKKNDEE